MVDFYKKYESLICFYTTKSSSSLRSPYKTAGTVFKSNTAQESNKFKSGAVGTLQDEFKLKHTSSFFAYRGYPKIHKFYSSPYFSRLESNFSILWTMDVAKCFESIYTHSLSWACKGKTYTKSHVTISSTFGQEFDSLMQRSNYGETNGIVIGPEISRIFAEIIFQEIDFRLHQELAEKDNLAYGVDYVFRRYVDDCFLFSKSENTAQIVYDRFSNLLGFYKMHINVQKVEKLHRPFLTRKSRTILSTSIAINEFFERFTERSDRKKSRVRLPKQIFIINSLVLSLINAIKMICSENEHGYDEIAGYVIASCVRRIEELISDGKPIETEEEQILFRDAFLAILEVLFFFYSVAPSVGASYKLCKGIILSLRFFEHCIPSFLNTIKDRVYGKAFAMLRAGDIAPNAAVDDYVSLEKINLILSIGDLGDDYLLPPNMVRSLFSLDSQRVSYHQIMSCLYYTKDRAIYKEINEELNALLANNLSDISTIKSSSEAAHLFLDALSCPYVEAKKKTEWLKQFNATYSLPAPTKSEIEKTIASFLKNPWFIQWGSIDLVNLLERKELRNAYA
jgi:hypothetical protein